VPLLRRLAYGFLDREGMRTEEMTRLRWRDVDLERGRVNLDKDKTDDPRDWDLRPDVVEALSRWKQLCKPNTEPDDHIFAENGIPLGVEHLAEQARNDLRRVGVTRPQLFESSATRQRFRAHDLRATFVTIALATGKTETWVSDRTGHDGHTMIDNYRRKARTWNMGELGPLYALISELSKADPSTRIAPRIPLKHTARVAKLADAADLGSERAKPESAEFKEDKALADTRTPETTPEQCAEWQSSGNQERLAELEKQLANVCRALADARTSDETRDLVAEKRDLRREIEALRGEISGNVVALRRKRPRPGNPQIRRS
jgi:Phage integrase family